ncbi:MAG: ArgR family transcriptional regulator [Bacteroidales bacterium]|nr:ArgR family transcriptional regulator [Bacteroidales bacterium]
MTSKQNRISLIANIIESETIRSQQEIIAKMASNGVEITQASLSRYLKELQASRVSDGQGGYSYKLPSSKREQLSLIRDQILSVEFAGQNMVVFRTGAGYANAVSVQIDARRLAHVAGTVSGDDTILMIIRDGYSRQQIYQVLVQEFPYIKDKIVNM